jgi:hypothetical protein
VAADGVDTGEANDAAQHGGDDDGVVGVAQDGDGVGDEVEGDREVGQQHEADSDAAGQGLVGR